MSDSLWHQDCLQFKHKLVTDVFPLLTVRRDVQENDEEAVRVKEQSILELGTLLAKTGQAAGNGQTLMSILCLFFSNKQHI